LKIACSKIDGIVARGRLDHAEGCNKNERWFAMARSTALLKEEAWHMIARPGRKACNGWVAIGQEDELVHLIGHSDGMRRPR
jgi:hypothetical protein